MVITSLENEKIKSYFKLQQKKFRDSTNKYLIEGFHMIEEAYKADIIVELIVLEGEEIPFPDIPYIIVNREVMKKVSAMETSSTLMAVCKKNTALSIVGNKLLLLDEIQDPGNLGTIIRSAVAFGVDQIILSENTVDLYNPKVLRSTQGMYCHIPIIQMNAEDAISFLKEEKIPVYGTNVEHGCDVRELNQSDKEKFCLVMGNEGKGVREHIQTMCDKNLYIALNKKVESLNVAIACSILLYELGR